MKAIAVLMCLAIVVPVLFTSQVSAQPSCRIERVTYRVEGLQMTSWIMKPAREGRFPVIVWIHGAKFAAPLAPIINESSPCHPFVVTSGWMIFFVQTPGYGGSEGPSPEAAYTQRPLPFLDGRADDVNSAVEWLMARSDVSPGCIANMGWSQGGLTALLASAKKSQRYRATIADAPGSLVALDGQTIAVSEMIRAGRNISTPILIQGNTEDPIVFIESTRVIVRELRRWGRAVEYGEYTHPSGHQLFNLPGQPALFSIWGRDATRFLEGSFAACAR